MNKSFRNSFRFIALLLAMVMVVSFVGCNNSKTEGKVSSNASSNNSSELSSDELSSESIVSGVGVDPVNGTIAYSDQVIAKEKEYKEVKAPYPSANLVDKRKGYFEKEANALRNKILNAPNTEKIYKIKGTKYYISPNGDDSNSGTSPKKAFKTIEPLNMLGLKSGDAVLFERGYIYRFNATIVAKSGVTYGSYGKGDKPAIYSAPSNYAFEKWIPINKANVWKSSYIYNRVVGMVLDHGEVVGKMKLSILDLKENGDFYHDRNTDELYLYSDKGIPSKVYESIEPLSDLLLINISNSVGNVVIDNLCLKYSGGFGVSAKFAGANITITNCELGYLGGREQGNGLRFGNAIEFWETTKNVKVENNWIYQTFDSALTWQGREGSTYENISFSNNLFECNNGDIEFFADQKATVKNFKVNNNIMRFTSGGWGTRVDDGGIRGIEGCVRAHTPNIVNFSKVTFNNNIMDCPTRQVINWATNPNQLPQISAKGNKVYINAKYRTSDIVVQGLSENSIHAVERKAKNQTELKAAFNAFDKTAIVKWFN